jgi:hypothetical protein
MVFGSLTTYGIARLGACADAKRLQNLQSKPAKSFRRDILEGISNSLPVFIDLQEERSWDIPSRKSFRRDILRGYLENRPFVFIDLARKCIFWGIYPVPHGKPAV